MSRIQVDKINTYQGHREPVYTVVPGPERWEFLSGAGDGMVVSWNLRDPDKGHLLANLPTSVYALCYIPSRKLIVVGQNYQGIHVINPATRKEVGSLKFTEAAIFDLFYQNGRLFVATGEGSVYIISLKHLRVIKRLKLSTENARCLAWDQTEECLAVGFSDNHIRILDGDTFKVKNDFEAHTNSVFSLKYHPFKRLLVSAGRDAHLRVWSIEEDYNAYAAVAAHMYAINHIEFSPSGHHFVTCSMDKSIKVWNSQDFRLLKVIDQARHASHGTSVNKLYWSTFEEKLVSCSDDRTIGIWDIKNLDV